MEIAILYEDDRIFVKIPKDEFEEMMVSKLGPEAKKAMSEVVTEIKKRTFNV